MANGPVPLVFQLQADALDRNMTTVDLVLRAKVVATKLGTAEALTWINYELGGYLAATHDELPKYRQLRGQPKFNNPMRGWCPIIANDDETSDLFSAAYLFQPVGELEQLVRDSADPILKLSHSTGINRLLVKQIGFACETGVMLSKQAVWGVVEKVRNLVLDWTLELEKAGVHGEGMSFTVNEKFTASAVTNNYFAHNIGVVGDVKGHATVTNTQTSTQVIDLDAVGRLLRELQATATALPQATQTLVATPMAELASELQKPKPDNGTVTALLLMLRSVCEQASGSIVATGFIEGVKAILGG